MERGLLILLHGVGSQGADLAPLGKAWRARLPDLAVAAPDAPFPFDQAAFDPGNSGRQWFSLAGITPATRPARIAAAREAFDRTLAAAIAGAGLTERPDRVVFAGFSQGAIMALDALASGRWHPAAIIAFSGRLASPEPLAPPPGSKALLVHGDADPVMPVAESRDAARRLAELGVETRLVIDPGVGHGISPAGAAAAERFLTEILS